MIYWIHKLSGLDKGFLLREVPCSYNVMRSGSIKYLFSTKNNNLKEYQQLLLIDSCKLFFSLAGFRVSVQKTIVIVDDQQRITFLFQLIYLPNLAVGNSICERSKGTIHPSLSLLPSANFFLALNKSHHFLLKKFRI